MWQFLDQLRKPQFHLYHHVPVKDLLARFWTIHLTKGLKLNGIILVADFSNKTLVAKLEL